MLETPTIIKTEAQSAAVIRLTIPREEIQNVMGPGIMELMSTLGSQGVSPAGPLFSHHLRMDPGIFDFEIGVPVVAPFTPAGRVEEGQLPSATVARTVYSGPYEGLGEAWGEFGEWIASEGHESAADLWECYLSGPESGTDSSKWQTQLNRPLLRIG